MISLFLFAFYWPYLKSSINSDTYYPWSTFYYQPMTGMIWAYFVVVLLQSDNEKRELKLWRPLQIERDLKQNACKFPPERWLIVFIPYSDVHQESPSQEQR